MSYLQLVTILFACISITACHDDDINSDQLSTDSFVANFHVTNGGTGTTAVEAQLRDTSFSFIDLKNGDQLLSSTIGPAEYLTINGDLFTNLTQSADQIRLMTGSFSKANFPSALLNFTNEVSGSLYEDNNTENTVYTISLKRPTGDNAPYSSATLPLNFSITAPQSDLSFSRSMEDIVVSWDRIDNTASTNVMASLNCTGSFITGFNETLTVDTGTITIPADTFTSPPDGNCTLRIIMDRYQTGTIDPHYAFGSKITSHQKRYVDVPSVP